jgi:hypothetical protein
MTDSIPALKLGSVLGFFSPKSTVQAVDKLVDTLPEGVEVTGTVFVAIGMSVLPV